MIYLKLIGEFDFECKPCVLDRLLALDQLLLLFLSPTVTYADHSKKIDVCIALNIIIVYIYIEKNNTWKRTREEPMIKKIK